MTKLIELRNISAGYNNKLILKNIDLTIFNNDFTAIIGPNGAGKTTLLKIILKTLQPFRGEVKYYFSSSIVNPIGYLPQISAVDKFFPITVSQIVLQGLLTGKVFSSLNMKQSNGKIIKMLERMGIEDLKDQVIGELSGGQMQRVFLARALVASPQLLVLDEPNTYLDKSLQNTIFDILQQIKEKIAILLVSHDVGSVMPLVKNIVCLDGSLKFHGPTEALDEKTYKEVCGCPFEIIAHGKHPHRILKEHSKESE